MNKVAILVFASAASCSALSNDFNLLDHYFNSKDDGGTLAYQDSYSYGKDSKGSDFDLCNNYSKKRVPGDKITAVSTYSGEERIKGIKLEYLYADDEEVGRTDISKYRKVLGNTEYIEGYRFYKKRDGNISRIKLYIRDVANNSSRSILFGGNNGWYKWEERFVALDHRSVIGFAGTASDTKIWSIYPCTADRLDLEETGVTIHWDRIEDTGNREREFFGENLAENNTNTDQESSIDIWYTDGTRETDTWTETLGVSVTAGVSLTQGYKAGVPATVESSGSITYSFSETWSASTTVGGTSEVNNQTTLKHQLKTTPQAGEVVLGRMRVESHEVNVPYTSHVRNPHNGDEFDFKGVIKGSDYSKVGTRWDHVGYVDNTRMAIFESFEWVVDHYNMDRDNTIIIEDDADNPF